VHQSRKRPPTLTPFPCRRRPCRRLRRPPPPVGGAVESTEGGLLPDSALSISPCNLHRATSLTASHGSGGIRGLNGGPPRLPPALPNPFSGSASQIMQGVRRVVAGFEWPYHRCTYPPGQFSRLSPCWALLRRPRTPGRNAEAGRLSVCMKSRALVPLCLLRFQSKLSSGAGRD